MLQRKLFLGARLKRLRRDRGLNQSQMAGELGISGSYLNHLERNQRPVTAGILLRLAEGVQRRREKLRVGRRRRRRRDPARRNLRRPDARRSRGQPLRAGRTGRRCTVGRRRDCAALRRCTNFSAIRRSSRTGGRPAHADHARNLGARLHPGAAQPLARARGAPRRSATRSSIRSSVSEPLRQRLKDAWGVDVQSSIPKSSRTPASITMRSGGR